MIGLMCFLCGIGIIWYLTKLNFKYKLNFIDEECSEECRMTNNCNDCDYKNECDVFHYGDIIDLKFANEIIDNQRRKIRELTKENTSLKKEIELREYLEGKLKKYAIGFKDWESDMK